MPKPKTPMQANGFSLLVPVAALIVLLAGGDRPAQAFIDFQLPTLYEVVKGTRLESGVGDKTAFEIAVLKVEKVNREKKAITYRKVRDLKGTFPGPNKQIADTFTHILREVHNPTFHTWDVANQDRLNDEVLALAAAGGTAVIFQRGSTQLICVGQAWYSVRVEYRPGVPQGAGSDTRYLRVFCGDVEELIAAVTDLLAGKEVIVPRMVGGNQMLNECTAARGTWRPSR